MLLKNCAPTSVHYHETDEQQQQQQQQQQPQQQQQQNQQGQLAGPQDAMAQLQANMARMQQQAAAGGDASRAEIMKNRNLRRLRNLEIQQKKRQRILTAQATAEGEKAYIDPYTGKPMWTGTMPIETVNQLNRR